MKKIAIDLTWVRHKKVGGTESCIRNLLDGFAQLKFSNVRFVLLVSEDNAVSFEKYYKYDCFELLVCDIESKNLIKRVLWQNLKMRKTLKKNNIRVCLEPVYGKPFFGTHRIKFITTIHDLQALHYPQYFSKLRVIWMKLGWFNAIKSSEYVIAISNYVKDDILANYNVDERKICVIYDAIKLDLDNCSKLQVLDEFGIKPGKYYYTVSSLFLHKNLKTVILTIAELKKRNSRSFYPLVVSGIGGRKRDELDELIAVNNLQNDIIFTRFVSNTERNTLYKNCRVFIFSSIFEGFGMPPLEAMALNIPVLTTKCTSLREVTGGLLNYVENPFDYSEWADKLEGTISKPNAKDVECLLHKYDAKKIAIEYIKIFEEAIDEKIDLLDVNL